MFSTDQTQRTKSASTGQFALALSYASSSASSLIHYKLLGHALIILHSGPMSLDVLNVWLHILLIDFLEQVPMFLSTRVPLSALGWAHLLLPKSHQCAHVVVVDGGWFAKALRRHEQRPQFRHVHGPPHFEVDKDHAVHGVHDSSS